MIHSVMTIFKGAGPGYYEYGNIEGRFRIGIDGFERLFEGMTRSPAPKSSCCSIRLEDLSDETLETLKRVSTSRRLRYAFEKALEVRRSKDEDVRREFLYPAVVEIVVWL